MTRVGIAEGLYRPHFPLRRSNLLSGNDIPEARVELLRKILWLDRDLDVGVLCVGKYLGGLLGLTDRTVRRHRATLLEKGLLRKERNTWFVV